MSRQQRTDICISHRWCQCHFSFPRHSILEKSVILVCHDNRPGNDEIYLRKSSDGGITFGNATNLSDNVGNSQSPQIQALGNITFVVWQDNRPGNDEIYLRKSSDGGITFGNATNLSDNVGNSHSPQIQALGNITFVVWQDNRPGNDEIYLRKSSDGGITFGNATNLSDNVGNSQSPQIQALGNITFVVWQDNRPGNDEIYLRKSSDGGITFGGKKNLSDNVGNSQSPQIQALGNITFVVWQDNRPGNDEIYLRKTLMVE